MATQNHVRITIPIEQDNQNQVAEEDFDYSQRAQWLHSTYDGLVSTVSLMMGVGAVQKDVNAMILTGFAWLFVGACSMAIEEFVSVYSCIQQEEDEDKKDDGLPNPFLAAMASAVAFSLGGIIPILAAGFIANHKVRLAVIVGAVILGIVSIWMNLCFSGQKYSEILCQSFNWWLNGYGHYLLTDQSKTLYWRGDVLGNFYSCPFT
ncbi:unnamed protein product [Withania somnifera]